MLVDDPDTASDNDVAAERIRVAEAYLACKRRHADLVIFETGGKTLAPAPALRAPAPKSPTP